MIRLPSLFLALVSFAAVACDDSSGSSSSSSGGTAPDASADAGGSIGQDGGVVGIEDNCPAPTGAGTKHEGFLAASETWTAEGSPHELPDGLSLATGVELTLGPCAVVKLGDGKNVNIGTNGKLIANGEQGRPVRITKLGSEAWGSIVSLHPALGLDLTYAIVEGGGKLPPGAYLDQVGMLQVRADQDKPVAGILRVRNVQLASSATNGVWLEGNAGFSDDSTNVIVTGAAKYAVLTEAASAGTIPPGTYSNNGGGFMIKTGKRIGSNDFAVSVTWRDRGAPYHVGAEGDAGGDIIVGAPSYGQQAKLTIEAGVTVRFTRKQNGRISVRNSETGAPTASLVAAGTAAKPIVFTSDEAAPQPGDWQGILFMGKVAADDVLDHVRIQFAGNEGTGTRSYSCGTPPASAQSQAQTMGGVFFASPEPPASAFMTNSTISDSASNGVDRGWTGAEIDFAATNTFERIAFCTQTQPRPSGSACPASPSCPRTP